MADLHKDFERIITLHKELSGRIKEYEKIVTVVPPIEVSNEIRYALRAVTLCISHHDNKEKFATYESDAYRALTCAYHDLLDALAIELTEVLDKIKDLYSLGEITQILGARKSEIMVTLNEVDQLTITSREDLDKRSEIYQKIYSEYFVKLCEHASFIKQAGEDIQLLHEENIKKESKQKTINYASIGVGILGIAIGVLGFFSN